MSYGWVVAAAGAVVFAVCGNLPNIIGVFVKPLIYEFGWSRAAVSGTMTARGIVTGLTSMVTGTLSDRHGPRKFILVGVLLAGFSYLLASQITSLWQLYLSLGLVFGIGMSACLVPILSTVTKWFGSKSALANGVALSGFGVAQIVLPPTVTYIILQYDWQTSFVFLGVIALVIGAGGWYFIRTPPATVRQPVKGRGESNSRYHDRSPTTTEGDYTLLRIVRTPALWLLFLIYVVVAASYHMVVTHIVAAATDTGITPEAASITLTFSGITGIVGGLTLGGMATKIGNRIVLVLCLAIQALGLFFLAGASDLLVFYIIAVVFGLAYGGTTPIVPALAAGFFGTGRIGSIIGILNIAYAGGAAFGPLIAGYIYDVTDSYYIAFVLAGSAMMITAILCLFLKTPQRRASTVSH